jgi:hypothetical protein
MAHQVHAVISGRRKTVNVFTEDCSGSETRRRRQVHTREASALAGLGAHRRDDSPARLGGAMHTSSAVAQRNARSTSAVFAWAVAAAVLAGFWARGPLKCGGQSSDGLLDGGHGGWSGVREAMRVGDSFAMNCGETGAALHLLHGAARRGRGCIQTRRGGRRPRAMQARAVVTRCGLLQTAGGGRVFLGLCSWGRST